MSTHAVPTDIALGADFAIVVVVATVLGFLARRTKQPTIVAYIFTGLLLGPVFLNIVTDDGLVGVMAELGLGFLLFLLGIKMRFDEIREILRPIVNIAVLQTVLQTALAFAVAWFLGFGVTDTVVIALATVFGATPVIVKILSDKDEITTLPGKIDVGVLIVQDIYLVIILAIFSAENLGNVQEIAISLGQIGVLMAGIGLLSYLSSRYLLPRLFREIADNKDVFFVVGVAWAFLFIYVAETFNLSVEVGAFLAGLSLAQLPYSRELEERVRPITDFFILVFFSTIGLQIAADELLHFWWQAVVASVVLMVGNFWIMFYLIDRENFSVKTSFIGSINMVQVSEFSLVVGALAVQRDFVESEVLGYLSLMALLTMSISTYIIMYNHWIYERVKPFFSRWESEEEIDVDISEYQNHAVVVGFDGMTKDALKILDDKYGVVVVDRNTAHIETLEDWDYDYIYGDFRHGEIRKAARLKYADFVLSSSVQYEINSRIVEEAKDATVFVEAETASDAARLYDDGADYVIMSTVLASERLAEYLRTYFKSREGFLDDVSDDLREIRGGDTDV